MAAIGEARRLLEEPLPCSPAEAERLLTEAEKALSRVIMASALASEAVIILSLVLALVAGSVARFAAVVFALLFSLLPFWVYISLAPLREAASRLRGDPGLIQSLCGLSLGEALRRTAIHG